MTGHTEFCSTPRWEAGSFARLGHGTAIALAHRAALLFPLIFLAPPLLNGEDPFIAPPAAFLLVAVIAALQGGLVVGLGLVRGGRVSLRDLGWRTENAGRDVLLGIAGFFMVAAIVLGLRGVAEGSRAMADVLHSVSHYTAAQRGLFVVIGVVAAFTEESIFRGYLQPSLVRRCGPMLGVIATALFFSVVHLQFALPRLLALLLIGLAYGVLRAKSHSLIAPAVANLLCWAILGAV
jgi:membrane protease YdiL (CAAX protease family)